MADKKINNLATLSETGRRKNNEDRVLGEASGNGQAGACVIIAVADGMGGLEAGEIASGTVHDMLFKLYQGGLSGDYNHIYGRIKDCIKTANRNIYEWSQKKGGIQMGTTVSGAIIIGNRYLVFNIGDSRTYLINKEGIRQISTDHSVDSEALKAGLIKEEEVGKGAYSNALTRTVGTDPQVDVDIFPIGQFGELKKGEILFCCTDGLWGRVKDENIRREIMARHDLKKSIQVLYVLAYKNRSRDNISMAAYRYGEFTGSPLKPEKSGPKEETAKGKGKRKNKISLPVILITLLVGFLVVIISFLHNYLSTPKKDTIVVTKVEQKQIEKKTTPGTKRTPLPPGKIFDPTAKRDITATRTTPPADDTREEQKPPEIDNSGYNIQTKPGQPTFTSTSPKPPNAGKGDAREIPANKTVVQATTPKPIEIQAVPMSELDPDVRANIEAKFRKITIDVEDITGITKGNAQIVISLDSSGAVKSIDITGIEVEPKDKINEIKSNLGQKIRSMNFPSPTINGKPVNVKIGINFRKVSKFSGVIIFEI